MTRYQIGKKAIVLEILAIALLGVALLATNTAFAISNAQARRLATYTVGSNDYRVEPSRSLRGTILKEGFGTLTGAHAIKAYLGAILNHHAAEENLDADFLTPGIILTLDIESGIIPCEFVQHFEAYRDINHNGFRDDDDEYIGGQDIAYSVTCN